MILLRDGINVSFSSSLHYNLNLIHFFVAFSEFIYASLSPLFFHIGEGGEGAGGLIVKARLSLM